MRASYFSTFGRAAIFTAGFIFFTFTGHAQLPAFPGAEGFGKFAAGARGGTVYHVTTTNDSGAGSFRDAVSVSGRTVVFDIGGIIDYKTPRYAPKANITIAGQTAPGDGVTLYGNGLSFSGSHNAIVRFMRVREGINGDSGTDAMGIANGHDMIFDHISDSWGRDETFSCNGSGLITNITIQSCIIAQGLQTHSAGGLIQTDGGVSILRCLYIDNDTRNPKVKFKNEFVNNVTANWETIGYNMGGDSRGRFLRECVQQLSHQRPEQQLVRVRRRQRELPHLRDEQLARRQPRRRVERHGNVHRQLRPDGFAVRAV